MRIGVFGGSFDPPHFGHLQVARSAVEQLKLDKVIWVPAFHPPHKQLPGTSFAHRTGMVRALIANDSTSQLSEIESSLPQPSYTLHTLQALKKSKSPEDSWYLLIGADNWAIFPQWHQPESVLAEATLVVYPRKGIEPGKPPKSVVWLDCPEIPDESRIFRDRMSGSSEDTLMALPTRGSDYIRTHGLYGTGKRHAT